jgi:radical SAM superfamily enzyme YgiQ (UPF0313 family)
MGTHLHLITPKTDFPHYYDGDVLGASGYAPAVMIADLASPTVAAMAPPDFHVTLVDENITPVSYDTDADFVGITGKVSQWGRMQAIAAEFRRRGKTVIIGGPYASLCPDSARPHCDILVQGEMEDIAERLFADLRERTWKDHYVGNKPDLARSPIPRWDLYPNDRAALASVQTSRGCPFECEFCDVIQYLGRKQRHKPVAQVLAELDTVYRHHYRLVFLCDDNFTVYRNRAKELASAIGEWNRRQRDGAMAFATQLSIDAARDDELLRLCAEAGLGNCFIGIETPNEESLREVKKRQNMHVDLLEEIQRFVDHGILVSAGMMVGFDHDGPDIFEKQYEFAMASAVPTWMITALVAPEATPLHARMAREGRLVAGGATGEGGVLDTNIVPRRMSREELLRGVRWLVRELYKPAAFGQRVVNFIDRMGPRLDPMFTSQNTGRRIPHSAEADWLNYIQQVAALGPDDAEMIGRIVAALQRKPSAMTRVPAVLFQYLQARHILRRFDAEDAWQRSVEQDDAHASA